MAYTYNPSQIGARNKDQMRFELGDVAVSEGAETAALTDGEIEAVLLAYPANWKKAKLALVESVCRRFAFEVDTTVGDLKLGLQARAKTWQDIYTQLKTETRYSVPTVNSQAIEQPHFTTGMMDHRGGKI